MTQSQQTHQEYLASLKFHSISSIVRWSGKTNSGEIMFLKLDEEWDFPYIEKDGLYYYFGMYPEHEYRLVCTADKDLGETLILD